MQSNIEVNKLERMKKSMSGTDKEIKHKMKGNFQKK